MVFIYAHSSWPSQDQQCYSGWVSAMPPPYGACKTTKILPMWKHYLMEDMPLLRLSTKTSGYQDIPSSCVGCDGDAKLQGGLVSRIHVEVLTCPETLEILIRDTSCYKNTRLINTLAPKSLYFGAAPCMPCQVIIRPGDPIPLSSGGETKKQNIVYRGKAGPDSL